MASWEWLFPNPAHSSGRVGRSVAVLLTQPTGEPELLSALAVACRGAAGGLLAQAARTIRQVARSDDFNMAVFTFAGHRRVQRVAAARVHTRFQLVARPRAQVECAAHQKGSRDK